jgi:beta-glucosidase
LPLTPSHPPPRCSQHFVNNDQETNRGSVDVVVDQATQHMTYYPPFAGAIQAGALAFMCSYNKINGHPACSSAASLLRCGPGYPRLV